MGQLATKIPSQTFRNYKQINHPTEIMHYAGKQLE